MSEFIVNEDYTITITPNGIWIPGTPDYTIFKCNKLKVNNKFALIWHIIWSMTKLDCVFAPNVHLGGGGIIMPTGIKCFTNGDNPMRCNDSGQCNGSFQPPGAPPPPPILCNCNFVITDAGQNKARCN